jgi:hypothetical protein
MAGEVVTVPTLHSDAPDWLGAIVYLAVLAYPDDVPQRDKFVFAAKALILRDYVDLGGDSAKVRAAFRKIVFETPSRDIYDGGRIRLAWRRIVRRRLPAADVASRAVIASVPNSPFEFVFDGVPVRGGVTAAIRGISARDGREQNDVMKRIWSESKPVLHLALALRNVLDEMGRAVSAHELLRSPAWVREAVKDSENALMLLDYAGVGLSAADAIRITYPA